MARNIIKCGETSKDKIKKMELSQSVQDIMIQSTQDAVDFLLLGNMPMAALYTKNTNLKGVSDMANYIALRIISKGDISEKVGQDYYVTFMTHEKYSNLKSEVDTILKATGNENLIVDLSK